MRLALGPKGVGGNFDFEAMRSLGIASMGGSGVGECLAAINRVRRDDIDSWANEFGALGDRLAREAEGALRLCDRVSAAEQLTRASTYYRIASLFLPHGDERQHRYRAASVVSLTVDSQGGAVVRVCADEQDRTDHDRRGGSC